RGTADGGNATGVHGCTVEAGRYVHYEEADARSDAQLHVVSVYGSMSGDDATATGEAVRVHLTRPGNTVLVLASYASSHWVVTAEPEVTIEGIILSGYHRQTVDAPIGVPMQEFSYSHNDTTLGYGIEWPSYDSANLVVTAERMTERKLTSFRGCFASTSFQIDEPGDLDEPRVTSAAVEPGLIPGCAALAEESSYCMTMTEGKLAMIGLDSGTLCHGPEVGITAYDSPSLAWVGDYIYTCLYDRGIARISVIDGSVDVAPVPCGMVTSHRTGLAATAVVDVGQSGSTLSQLVHFSSFEDAAQREVSYSYGETPQATRVATSEDKV
ncbi:MAG: hypothetical protein AAGC55_05990, partial [Myxococcota bacterium]